VGAVQLPGHGDRIGEPPLTGFAEVMRCLREALKPELDRPFALFGHSLGALLAFELARWLRDRHGREPVHLFVSGHNAPQAPDERENLSALDEPATIDMLRRLGCAPEAILQHQEFMRLALPVIRADFAVYEDYSYQAGQPLQCPLSVFSGIDDPRTNREGLQAWREHSKGPFAVRYFPGDHSFVTTEEEVVARAVADGILSYF